MKLAHIILLTAFLIHLALPAKPNKFKTIKAKTLAAPTKTEPTAAELAAASSKTENTCKPTLVVSCILKDINRGTARNIGKVLVYFIKCESEILQTEIKLQVLKTYVGVYTIELAKDTTTSQSIVAVNQLVGTMMEGRLEVTGDYRGSKIVIKKIGYILDTDCWLPLCASKKVRSNFTILVDKPAPPPPPRPNSGKSAVEVKGKPGNIKNTPRQMNGNVTLKKKGDLKVNSVMCDGVTTLQVTLLHNEKDLIFELTILKNGVLEPETKLYVGPLVYSNGIATASFTVENSDFATLTVNLSDGGGKNLGSVDIINN